MAHWYLPVQDSMQAETAHDIGMKQAREIGALPSITGVEKMIAADGLTIWLMQEAVKKSLQYPIESGQDPEEYAKFIQVMQSNDMTAADKGTVFHNLTERYARGERSFDMNDYSLDLVAGFQAFRAWFDENVKEVLAIEEPRTNVKVGYGGTVDLVYRNQAGEACVLDYKTSKNMRKYPKFARQLAACSKMYPELKFKRYQNMLISTTDAGQVKVIEHSKSDIADAWKTFQLIVKLWKRIHKWEA